METNREDPFDWTIDEVVNFLCHNSKTPWSQSTSRLPRPDPTSLETTLRDNLITGEVLLQDVDKDALRDDLNLKALGHRSCIMMAIRYLQQHSFKFQQSHGPASHSERIISPSVASPIAPHLKYVTPQPVPGIALPTTSSPRNPYTIGTLPETPQPHPNLTDDYQRAPGVFQGANVPNLGKSLESPISVHIRPREHIAIDSQGRKRRRLNLSSPDSAHNENMAPEYAEDEIWADDWYMGPAPLAPAQIFYPSIPCGENPTFSMICPKLPPGQRAFVNKRLNHFFRQQPIRINSEEKSHLALVPYQPMMVNDSSRRFFTLYTERNGKVTSSKEKVGDWPQLKYLLVKKGEAQISSNDEFFSRLLDKYREDPEDALPLYGDSGSEGAFDDETWQEIEDENSEHVPKKTTKLDLAEIDSIIQTCVAEYEKDWRQVALPKQQTKARRLWISARKGKRTNDEIKITTNQILRLEASLKKFQKAVRENEYTSSNELHTQCKSLEETVSGIQKQKWRLSVLEKASCPPKVSLPRPPNPRNTLNLRQGDEESLYSESDAVSTGSLDDFIDDSEVINHTMERESFSVSSDSDGDDDMISVSGTIRRSRPQRHNFFASSSPSPPPATDITPVIDLTMESPEPDEFTIETPPLNPVQSTESKAQSDRGTSVSPAPSLGSMPMKSEKEEIPPLPKADDIESISSVPWEILESRKDRIRLLVKLIACLPPEELRNLRKRIPKYRDNTLRGLVESALKALRKGREKVRRLNPHENQLIMRTASLYISWVNCAHLQLRGIPKSHLESARSDLPRFRAFFYKLCDLLHSFGKREPRKTHVEPPEPAGTPEHVDLTNSPHKKRKRAVKESQEAKLNQETAQRRVALQDEQRERLEKALETKGLNNEDPNHQAVSFGSPVIYLDPHIGRRVKPHQLKGIQFMWRELIEDQNQQGCLLAHTMGLGKTMQVISLLATISIAANSKDSGIRRQIPEHFHRSQTLILCPPSLIENWYDEFVMWTPKNPAIGPLRQISSSTGPGTGRLEEISNWNREGGILIMGYSMFRLWILNKKNKRGKALLSETDHSNVRQWLLKGPNIIVADEAHYMKNPDSAITAAASQFRSKSRIALTGSPLANSLSDYFTMVNWIAEGYLGGFIEFKANYIEPIQEGLYADSTHYERRRSLRKLEVLKRILNPKINRADITVLEGSLPPKVEFVITVPLSLLQKHVYDTYVLSVLSGASEDTGNTRIWAWLAILGLCCHHPACFRQKLLSRANDDVNQIQKLDESEQDIPGDEPIIEAGISNVAGLVSAQEKLFAGVPDMMALSLSPRAEILNRIIDESIMAGDKVLVFSLSIPTLNFIEHILKTSGRSYSRLDGSTPINSRQEAIKQFNAGTETEVYLISTRAGGLGLNIPGANRVIIFDFSFSPTWEEQAVGRAYRLGQKKPVYVYRFVAGGTFEEVVHQKAVFKTQLAYRVIDKKNPIRYANKKLGEYLFAAKQAGQEDVTEFLGKDPLVLDKIIREEAGKEERIIRKITLTQTFELESNDKLTEEESRGVEEELEEERLRRTDPQAYFKLIDEKQRHQLHMPEQPLRSSSSFSYFPRPYSLPAAYQPSIPLSARNDRPPALAPDTSIMQRPTPSAFAVASSAPPLLGSSFSQGEPPMRASMSPSLPSTDPAIYPETTVTTGGLEQQHPGPARGQSGPLQPGP